MIRVDLPCAPCNRIRLPPARCTGHIPDCLALITPDRVLVITTAALAEETRKQLPMLKPEHVIAEMTYEHPTYTAASVAAQTRLAELNTDRLAFAGAYFGWGFHEDGCRAGYEAADAIGEWAAGIAGNDVEQAA